MSVPVSMLGKEINTDALAKHMHLDRQGCKDCSNGLRTIHEIDVFRLSPESGTQKTLCWPLRKNLKNENSRANFRFSNFFLMAKTGAGQQGPRQYQTLRPESA